MEIKKVGFIKKLDSFHQTSWNFVGISTVGCGSYWRVEKIKMAAVAMVTKVQKMLNSLQTSQSFAVMFPATSTSGGTREAKKFGIGRTNFAAVAMEIKKGGFFKKNFDFFHQVSWNIVGIFTVVCGSFWHVDGVGWCPLFFSMAILVIIIIMFICLSFF